MRHHILIIGWLLCTIPLHSQSFFSAYQNEEGVQYLTVSPMMFRLLGQMNLQTDDPDTAAYLQMIQSIRSFKVLMTQQADMTASLDQSIEKWVASESLALMLQLEETDHLLRFYAELGPVENQVKRLLMFSKGKHLENTVSIAGQSLQSVVVYLEGEIDLALVGRLTELMDLPGGNQLKKIQQRK